MFVITAQKKTHSVIRPSLLISKTRIMHSVFLVFSVGGPVRCGNAGCTLTRFWLRVFPKPKPNDSRWLFPCPCFVFVAVVKGENCLTSARVNLCQAAFNLTVQSRQKCNGIHLCSDLIILQARFAKCTDGPSLRAAAKIQQSTTKYVNWSV